MTEQLCRSAWMTIHKPIHGFAQDGKERERLEEGNGSSNFFVFLEGFVGAQIMIQPDELFL